MSLNEPQQSERSQGKAPDEFKDLADEFTTSEKTSEPIDEGLVKIIEGLINDKLPKAKMDELSEKYSRPSNCKLLLAPKANKAVWNQLKDHTKKNDIGMQRCQKLFLNAAYAILQASKTTTGAMRANLVHALVLILSGNREINLKRRELLKPDLNSQYNALCSTSTPITTELFGDDVGKEIDEVAKANKLGKKLATPRRSRGSRYQPYNSQGRFAGGSNSQSRARFGGRGFSRPQAFLGERNTDRRKPFVRSAPHTKTTQD